MCINNGRRCQAEQWMECDKRNQKRKGVFGIEFLVL